MSSVKPENYDQQDRRLKGEPQFFQSLIVHYIYQDSLFWSHVRLFFITQGAFMAGLFTVNRETERQAIHIHCFSGLLHHIDFFSAQIATSLLLLFVNTIVSAFLVFAMIRCLQSRNGNVETINIISGLILADYTITTLHNAGISEPLFNIFPRFIKEITTKTAVPAYVIAAVYCAIFIGLCWYVLAANGECIGPPG